MNCTELGLLLQFYLCGAAIFVWTVIDECLDCNICLDVWTLPLWTIFLTMCVISFVWTLPLWTVILLFGL